MLSPNMNPMGITAACPCDFVTLKPLEFNKLLQYDFKGATHPPFVPFPPNSPGEPKHISLIFSRLC
jgi:hypothetical protein